MPIAQDQQFGMIPLEFIRESATNPRKRFNEIKLKELAASIEVSGVGQPILVRPLPGSMPDDNLLEIVAGARRFRASLLAGKHDIPALVCNMTDVEVRKFQLVENLQREDVHPMEEAEGYRALMDEQGLTVDDLIDEMGKSRAYIYGRLKLCSLAPSVRETFIDEHLPASTALLIARIPVQALQVKAAEEILAGRHNSGEPMSVRQAEEHIASRYTLAIEDAEFDARDADLVPSAGTCFTCPKLLANQPEFELYSNLKSADVCTDPDCFEIKNRTHAEKIVSFAKKKKIPVFDSMKEFRDAKTDALANPGSALYRFERIADTVDKQYETATERLQQDLLPNPKAYVKEGNSVVPVYEKTAIQEALEKAGLALTVEKHAELIAEKLAAGGGGTGPASVKPAPRQPNPDEIAAERECKFREALYKKIRAARPSIGDILRPMAKMLLLSNNLPDIDGIQYDFDIKDDDAIEDFMEQAPIDAVQDLAMDLLFSDTLEVSRWLVRNDEILNAADYKLLLELASASGVDAQALRDEMLQPAQEPAPADPIQSHDPAPLKAKKGKKTPVVGEETKSDISKAWPFPTAESIAAAKAAGEARS